MKTCCVAKTALGLGLMLGITGCGQRLARVTGTVTLDGQPIDNATVTLYPESGEGQPCGGLTRADGTFDVETPKGKKGAFKGDYKVLVSKLVPLEGPPAGKTETLFEKKRRATMKKSVLPESYSKLDTTPFRTKVPRDSPLELALTSKADHAGDGKPAPGGS